MIRSSFANPTNMNPNPPRTRNFNKRNKRDFNNQHNQHNQHNQKPREPQMWNDSLHYLRDDMPRREYRKRSEPAKVVSDGQRKLYLAEHEFLITYAHEGDLVVYAGAAPGHHLVLLAKKHSTLEFRLYDPREYCKELIDLSVERNEHEPEEDDGKDGAKSKHMGKIVLNNVCFDDDTARSLRNEADAKDRRLIFISDIRTAGSRDQARVPEPFKARMRDTHGEGIDVLLAWIETRVEEDMDNQANWLQIMRPAASSLKTRFPWPVPVKNPKTNKKTNVWVTRGGVSYGDYLDGRPFIQPRARPASTEIRLFVAENPVFRRYDYTQIEEQFSHFNNVDRPAPYRHSVGVNTHGYLDDYDLAAEISIHRHYLLSKREIVRASMISFYIKELSLALGRAPIAPQK